MQFVFFSLLSPTPHDDISERTSSDIIFYIQNELFQSEARRVLGDNFLRDSYGDDTAAGAAGAASSGGRGAPAGAAGPSRSVSGRVQPAGAQPQQQEGGIMRALSSMGSAAKRNLTQLAQSFNSGSSNNNSGNNNNATTGGNNASRGGFGGGSPPPPQPPKRRGSAGGNKKKGSYDDLEDVSGSHRLCCSDLFCPLYCDPIYTANRTRKRAPKSSPSPAVADRAPSTCSKEAGPAVGHLLPMQTATAMRTSTQLTLCWPGTVQTRSNRNEIVDVDVDVGRS